MSIVILVCGHDHRLKQLLTNDPNLSAYDMCGDTLTPLQVRVDEAMDHPWPPTNPAEQAENQRLRARVDELEANQFNASAKLSDLQAELAKAAKDVESWKREVDIYAHAWTRELGSWEVPKTHQIDGLVLGTQRLVDAHKALAGMAERIGKLFGLGTGEFFSTEQLAKRVEAMARDNDKWQSDHERKMEQLRLAERNLAETQLGMRKLIGLMRVALATSVQNYEGCAELIQSAAPDPSQPGVG